MDLVTLIVVLNHLPCDIQLSFMPNGHVADVKTPFVLFCFVFFSRCMFIYFHLFHLTINCFLFI